MGAHWMMDPRWGLSALEGLWRASWQGALWAALVWALTRAVPRMPSALRAALWWLVSLKFVLSLGILSPVPLPLLPAEAPAGEALALLPGAAPVTVVTGGSPHLGVASAHAVPWREVGGLALLAVWGLGIAWQMRGHVRAWALVRRLRMQSRPLSDPELEEVIQELTLEAGLRRVPRLLVSNEVASPLATGLFSPVVVLPARAVQRLDSEALRMALAHELAHFQRRDLWLGWVPAFAETVLFFHPLVRKAVREYALAREEACDAEALRLTGAEPGDYGQLLLSFGVTRPHGTAAALGASSHIHALHRRLTMLEHVDVSTPRGRIPLRAALIVLGLAVLVPFQVVAREPAPPQASPAPEAVSAAPVVAPAPAQESKPAMPPAAQPKVAAAPKPPAVPAAPKSVSSSVAAPKVASVPPAPPVAPLPPGVPILPVLPAPPPPPAAPKLAMADSDDDDDDMDGFVLVSGNSVTMAGSTSDIRRAKALQTGGKDVLFVRRGDKSYVIRDPKMLDQMRAAFEPQKELGNQQSELGKKQSALGEKQAEFGQKQAALGMKQAELGMKQADISMKVARASTKGDEAERERLEKQTEQEQEALEKEMEALEQQQEALGKEQDSLGEQQEKLGEQQEKLGEQQEKVAREGQKKLNSLIDEAINKGLAEIVES